MTAAPVGTLGVVSWRLPCALLDAPALATEIGACRLQVDYGGPRRSHELLAGGRLARELRHTAEGSGVELTALALNALNDIGVPVRDSVAIAERNALVRGGLDTAADLGISTVVVPAFRKSLVRDVRDLELTTEFLAEVARAAPAGVSVAHENVLSPAKLTTMMAALNDYGVRVVLDAGNLFEYGVDWREYLRAASPFLHHEVHLKDFHRPPAGSIPLGMGVVPLLGLVGAVRRTGRLRCLVLETDHRRSTHEQLRADAEAIIRLLKDDETGARAYGTTDH